MSKETREYAKQLVSQMTLEEKMSQMVYQSPAIERLGIPAYNWWNEALHGVARAGVATVFPQAIGLAATFDKELLQEIGDVVSTEGRAKFNEFSRKGDRGIYKGLTFWAPNVNIFRDPRWGRGHETYGEDPYLTGELGCAYIRGLQGPDPDHPKAAACAKHFAVHSGPEAIRHEFDARVSKHDLYDTYLYAFKRCVKDAKVEAVMGAYNRVNGEPACGSKTLLKDILRDEFGFYMKHKTAMKNNLIGILDQTYPGVNTYFDSPARSDGSQKWVDFASTYWHVDCVRKMSLNAFIDHYQNWCKRKKYNFSQSKAEEIYGKAKELVPVLPKDAITKLIIKQAVDQLNSASTTVESLRTLMNETASKLPEYPVVMAMKGVGTSLGSQLMAEIGDVSRFTHKSAITAFAGVDPGVNESGTYAQKSVPTSKRGSSDLRKTLFQVMDVLIKTHPEDDPVYQFLDKKRAQGKPYYVYMTAGANKFLRIYYGRVKEYLSSLPES